MRIMSLSLVHPSYLFGCCAACRAPFVPPLGSIELFEFQETQTVTYLMSRFKKISADLKVSGSPSDFTAEAVDFHVVYQSHVRPGLAFVRGLAAADLEKAVLKKKPFVLDTKSRKGTGRAAGDEEAPGQKTAWWELPARAGGLVRHEALGEYLQGHYLLDFSVDLDNVIPCCSLCNNIWDAAARLSRVLRDPSVVPARQVRASSGGGRRAAELSLPDEGVSDANYKAHMGCLAAFYVHHSVAQLYRAARRKNEKFSPKRLEAISLLAWLPMHAHCLYQEMGQLATGERHKKGRHNYLGCLDLVLSYYLYVMLRTDPLHAGASFSALPFEKFHVYYAKELSEAPEPCWDPALPRLHDAVFDEAYQAAAAEGEKVEACSGNLVRLYAARVRPLVGAMTGSGPSVPAAEAFFLTSAEAAQFDAGHSEPHLSNVRVHLRRAGASAVLWQLLRALREEDEAYQLEVQKWLKSRMELEWANMAAHSGGRLRYAEAQYVYALMHTLRRLDGAARALEDSTHREVLDLVSDRRDSGDILEDLRRAGRCSMWKAAHRLRDWQFTEDPEEDKGEPAFWDNLAGQPRRGVARRGGMMAGDLADGITLLLEGLSLQ